MSESTDTTFGLVKPCTPEELEKEIALLCAKCTLAEMGTFYFCFEIPAGQPFIENTVLPVVLKYYDSSKGVLHTSRVSCFKGTRVHRSVVAVDRSTFVITTPSSNYFIMLSNSWDSCKVVFFDEGRERLLEAALQQSHEMKTKTETRLSKIRTGTPGDFQLKSTDGELIAVHTSVLVPQWQFFAAAVQSDMKEKEEKVLEIQAPKSTLEVIVRHFYEQDLQLQFADAANLIVVAQMYDLPELLGIATDKIKSHKKNVAQNLTAWQKSLEAKNEDLRKYAAGEMQRQMKDVVKNKERIDDMSKEDVVMMLMDMSLSASEPVTIGP